MQDPLEQVDVGLGLDPPQQIALDQLDPVLEPAAPQVATRLVEDRCAVDQDTAQVLARIEQGADEDSLAAARSQTTPVSGNG